MRRLVLVTAALLFAVSVSAADAQIIRMNAELSGDKETPAPGILTGAYGTARVEVNMNDRSISWTIEIFNLPSGINNAHFHVGGPGNAGPTVVNIPFTANASNEFTLTGSATTASALRPDQGIRSWDDFLQSLVGGQVYINIHTAVNGGGEIRGQVLRDR
jgi:hypothetical protein